MQWIKQDREPVIRKLKIYVQFLLDSPQPVFLSQHMASFATIQRSGGNCQRVDHRLNRRIGTIIPEVGQAYWIAASKEKLAISNSAVGLQPTTIKGANDTTIESRGNESWI